jgi:hypothetical protein
MCGKSTTSNGGARSHSSFSNAIRADMPAFFRARRRGGFAEEQAGLYALTLERRASRFDLLNLDQACMGK